MLKHLISYFITLFLFCEPYAEELRKVGFFTNASLLYWQAEEEGLAYAVESGSTDHLAPHASVKNPKFEWDFGFKLGLGYRTSHDRWEWLLHFTSFQTHSDTEQSAHDGNVFFPVWIKPATAEMFFADQVKAHWRLHLGLLDVQLSKPFFTSDSLTLTPQMGVRNGWIRQKFNIEYRGGNFPVNEEELIRMKNKYWGIGPSAGLSAEWSMFWNLSLFAKGSLSLLFGEFYLHQDEDTLGTKEKRLGIHSIFQASAPIVDCTAGLSWQHLFSGRFNRLTCTLAWDQLLFFSQNQLMRFTDSSSPGLFIANQGDLSIAGVEFNARFDF